MNAKVIEIESKIPSITGLVLQTFKRKLLIMIMINTLLLQNLIN